MKKDEIASTEERRVFNIGKRRGSWGHLGQVVDWQGKVEYRVRAREMNSTSNHRGTALYSK